MGSQKINLFKRSRELIQKESEANQCTREGCDEPEECFTNKQNFRARCLYIFVPCVLQHANTIAQFAEDTTLRVKATDTTAQVMDKFEKITDKLTNKFLATDQHGQIHPDD